MRETEERVTVVNTDGGGGGMGLVAGIIGAVVAIVLIVWLFGAGLFTGGSRNIDVDVDLPRVEAPADDAPAAD
jgi:uncharacterized membrane protein